MKDYPNMDERSWLLLNGQVDGELNAAEQQEFDALLAGSSELQTVHAELAGLNACLQQVPEKVLPPYLHKAITSTVRLPTDEPARSRKRGVSGWLTEHWLGPAFALAAGVLLTVGVYETSPDTLTAADTANMSGTITNPGAALKGMWLDRVELGANTVYGTAQLHKSGRDYLLDVQLNSDAAAKFTVAYAAHNLKFMGVTSSVNPVDEVTVDQQYVTVGSNGQQHYLLTLRSSGDSIAANQAPLKVSLSVNNGLPHQAELQTGKK